MGRMFFLSLSLVDRLFRDYGTGGGGGGEDDQQHSSAVWWPCSQLSLPLPFTTRSSMGKE